MTAVSVGVRDLVGWAEVAPQVTAGVIGLRSPFAGLGLRVGPARSPYWLELRHSWVSVHFEERLGDVDDPVRVHDFRRWARMFEVTAGVSW